MSKKLNKQKEQKKQSEIACEKKVVHLTQRDLPLCCPMPEMILWNAHPRVYLPIEKTGQAVCPYCGTKYILK